MRGFLLGLISAALVGGALIAPTPAQGVAGFGDVDEHRYFTQAVQWMVDNGITTGTSEAMFLSRRSGYERSGRNILVAHGGRTGRSCARIRRCRGLISAEADLLDDQRGLCRRDDTDQVLS